MNSLKSFLIVWTMTLIGPQISLGQVISPSGQEVKFSVASVVTVNRDQNLTAKQQVQFHVSHLFGIFHSPELISDSGLDPSLIDGIGAPQSEMNIKIVSQRILSSNKLRISYQAAGTMLLEKHVAKIFIAKKTMAFPLPSDPYEIYQAECTDEHYSSFGDFWYFYDPYRAGCESLRSPPLAQSVQFNFSPAAPAKQDASPRLDLLRANNGNGDLFTIAIVHGYSDGWNIPNDDGRTNFNELNAFLRKQGFEQTSVYSGTTHPIERFTKSVPLANGKRMEVQINHLLVETTITSRTVSFAKFFKEAVSTADVIFYSGHSGLGMNLDIPLLEQKAGKFVFNPSKRQIFFFDSCASYSYYLSTFSAQKTRAKIDVVTNGLSSFFMHGEGVLEIFLGILLDPKINDMPWSEILKRIESTMNGVTSLINVGGI